MTTDFDELEMKYNKLINTTVELIDNYDKCLFMPCNMNHVTCKECIERHIRNGDMPIYNYENIKKD